MASLRESGIQDLNAFFKSKPQALHHALSLVRLVDVNEITLRLWEISSKEELLDRWADLFTDKTYDVFSSELLAIWEGRNEMTYQCSSKTATGRPIHYEMHWVAPIIDGQMNLRQVIVAIVDLTEIKEKEEKLRESEKKYRTLTSNIPGMVYRAETDWSAEIISSSEIIFGYSTNDFRTQKRNWLDIIHPADKKRVIEESSLLLEKPVNIVQEYRIVTRNGSTRWVSDHKASFFNEEGMIVSIDGIVFDISDRKRMEEELIKIQKLESIGVFAGGIAHDFNNILATLVGNISLAKDKEMSKDEIFELLSGAEKASKRAQSLTKQLLTFAKGGTPVKETAAVGDVIKESSSFVLRGSKSGCEFSIAKDLWPVDADVGQISQVVNNIVINANQAMPEGGIIKIKAENLIIENGNQWKLKPGRYILISIKDKGIGIASKHFSKIFDPYFTTKQMGSGLGLSTSYSIIKNHDGHITVESKLGSGTTFHIYLPASENSVPIKEEIRVIKGHGRILVMDDDEMLREVVGKMLKTFGYDPEFARDGAEAIKMYDKSNEAEKPYDAVILDLTVPGGMGGKEAIQKLLVIDPEAKIIVSSGYSDDRILSNFQEYGLKGVIPKPFELGALSKVLHEVLNAEEE
jgi:PAS domain S-box-containing protein